MIDEIKIAVQDAAARRQKMAMFHFQVLKNATELEDLNAKAFCKEVAVPTTYQTEFRKMIGLARLMRELGVSLPSN